MAIVEMETTLSEKHGTLKCYDSKLQVWCSFRLDKQDMLALSLFACAQQGIGLTGYSESM